MDGRSIIQLSTPRVISALHVIRMSGGDCLSFLKHHTDLDRVEPRRVYHRNFFRITQRGQELIDSVICFFFLAPRSYTGEDMVEIHTHGSLLIVDEIIRLAQNEGFRLALPGEFTYRGFLNGKISLDQAEAIDGLIHSRSDFQKQNALQILEKKVSFQFIHLRESIAMIQAELESVIEFPEEDIPEIVEEKKSRYQKYQKKIEEIITYFEDLHRNYRVGLKLAEGFRFVIIGSPNSGKSTLFNLLLREGRVLVSDEKGTTRDYISERYTLSSQSDNDFEVILYDTAGIHENPESIEAMGIEKLPQLAAGADLVIWLLSGWECYREFVESGSGRKILSDIKKRHSPNLKDHLWVFLNKMDIITQDEVERIISALGGDFPELFPPIQSRFSLLSDPESSREKLESLFREWITTHYQIDNESPALLNRRQGDLVQKIITVLQGVHNKIAHQEGEEILAEDLRRLNYDLKELSLETGPEEVYDLLFSRFCIGK